MKKIIQNIRFYLKSTPKSIICFTIPLLIIYILVSHIFLISKVQSESMEPTLSVGDAVVFNRLSYIQKLPERGDIIIFIQPDSNKLLAKRVIGLPGDQISFKEGYVYINNTKLDESNYLENSVTTYCLDEYIVPENCFFLLGDNRSNSADSRYWDNPYVSLEKIKGKFIFEYSFFK